MAGLQRDCLHRQQLLAAGIGRGAIVHRLKTQRYTALHCDVYLVRERPLDLLTRATSAALHLRGDAVLSHRIGGFVWELVEDQPREIELTLVGRNARTRRGVQLHRVTSLDPRDVTWRRDLPVTTPARTVVDLAGVLDTFEMENAIAVCLERGLARLDQIRAAIERAPRRAGAGTLRRLLEQGGFSRTRSFYERVLLRLILQAGLPKPLTNVPRCGHMVDYVWDQQRLVVEFDGFKFHGDRRAFESDRRRDQDLVAAGYRVIRVTARQLEEEPYAVIARIAASLA